MASESDEIGVSGSSGNSVKERTLDKDTEFKQWVTFNINDELFAVDALQVIEVQKYGQITPVPGSEEYVCGLINLRGKVITVIDARIMFGLPEKEPDDDTNIVLIDFNQEEMVGFIVDSVDEVVNISTKGIEVTPRVADGDLKSGFVKGVGFHEKKMIIFLDVEKIIFHISPEVLEEA